MAGGGYTYFRSMDRQKNLVLPWGEKYRKCEAALMCVLWWKRCAAGACRPGCAELNRPPLSGGTENFFLDNTVRRSIIKNELNNKSSGFGEIPYRRYSPRAPSAWTGEIPVPTVKSGWEKMKELFCYVNLPWEIFSGFLFKIIGAARTGKNLYGKG